jgi:hypothetical protein
MVTLCERKNAAEDLEVTLLWDSILDQTVVRLQSPILFDEFEVSKESALDAFYHPFTYMPQYQ